jgi:hypothetical protein
VSRDEDAAACGERIARELREAAAEAAGVLKDLIAARDNAVRVTANLATDMVTNQVESILGPKLQRIGVRMDELDAGIAGEFNRSMTDLQDMLQRLIKDQSTVVITSYTTTREQMQREGLFPPDLT